MTILISALFKFILKITTQYLLQFFKIKLYSNILSRLAYSLSKYNMIHKRFNKQHTYFYNILSRCVLACLEFLPYLLDSYFEVELCSYIALAQVPWEYIICELETQEPLFWAKLKVAVNRRLLAWCEQKVQHRLLISRH